ncbi:Glutathione synthetase [Candidatus Cyrtobacter comes]|uniref:Glutathione synthetase n=1 Tax=Candidatus Cyrtobacter comes TaxID=675776 RepID=A0ABU5L9H7_9RICK|nr:glutathione synthase [Candidatus Cyrtobacter comes]MDZ5762489.1 Glutathione synthetase [Candidatus Cyrtobacter comes]
MKIGVIMDNIHGLNLKNDSTLRIAKALSAHGNELFFIDYEKITLSTALIAECYTFNINDCLIGKELDIRSFKMELSDCDIILIRKDPPFDMKYITLTYLLDIISKNTLILNSPASIRAFPEKLSPLLFKNLTPDTIISADLAELIAFLKKYKKIVIKPIYQHGGRDVEKISFDEYNCEAKIAAKLLEFGHIIAQDFIDEVGDKRVIMLQGRTIGQFKRIPQEGEFRANIALGSSVFKTDLTQREREICEIISNFLINNEIFLAGIDIAGEKLIEINITSPTGIVQLNKLYGEVFEEEIASAIETKFHSWYKPATR